MLKRLRNTKKLLLTSKKRITKKREDRPRPERIWRIKEAVLFLTLCRLLKRSKSVSIEYCDNKQQSDGEKTKAIK